MRYRKQTADGDYSFGASQLDFYRDIPEAPGQAVKTRLLLWVGEYFLDITEGTPYMQGIFGKYSEATASAIIQDRVLGTQGVVDIYDFATSLDPDTRGLTVTCTIDTIYGPTAVQIDNYTKY